MAAAMAFAASTEVRVKNFDESDGFAESPVTCILQDSIGFIWLSTWDGLYRYDGSHCLAVVDGTSACLVSRADAVNLMETVRSIVLGGEESGG